MQVETFEIEDAVNEASQMANDAYAAELIEELGLVGQKSIMNDGTITRVPYRIMDKIEYNVYKTLCPKSCNINDYRIDAIPVRVLEAYKKAMECGFFDSFRIWYPAEARIDDPVLVGIKKEHNQSGDYKWTSDIFYIIARWGKILPSFEQCEAMAVNMLKKKKSAYIKKLQHIVNTEADTIDDNNDIESLFKDYDFSEYKVMQH